MTPHPFEGVDHCPTCNAWLRALVKCEFRAAAIAAQHKLPPDLDCFHLGDELSPPEFVELGLNPYRRYFRCSIGLGTRPGVACRCDTCGPKCPGYVPGTNE